MTLSEAAGRPNETERQAEQSGAGDRQWTAAEMARFIHLMDWQIHVAKMRREEALREARRRGLDAEEAPQVRPKPAGRPNRARRNPRDLACVLLRETSLRLHEIVEITGLDVYEVAGFKLKLQRGLL